MTYNECKQALTECYGVTKAAKFSGRFIDTMVSDYKRKAANLKWLFKGKDKLIIELPRDMSIRKLKSNSKVAHTIKVLESAGATITDEQLLQGKCTYKNQEFKIRSLLKTLSKLPKEELIGIEGIEFAYKRLSIDKIIIQSPDHLLVTINNKVKAIGWEDFTLQYLPNCLVANNLDVYADAFKQSSSSVTLSIDIKDFITCSNGSVRSCYREGGEHHLGWVQAFRSDFAAIMYTHNGDQLHKTGRQWVYFRLTEGCLPYEEPFIKFQKRYGDLESIHVDTVFNEVTKCLPDIKLVKRTGGNIRYNSISPNSSTENGSHMSIAGYIDRNIGDGAPLYKTKDSKAFDEIGTHGISVFLNFPDALTYEGLPTCSGNFEGYQNNGTNRPIGLIPPYKYVICSVSGKQVFDVDAVLIEDKWISKDCLLAGTNEVEEVELEVAEPEADEDLSDIDLEDF